MTLAVICDGFLLLISLIIIGKVIGDGAFTLAPLSPSPPSSFTGLSLALAFGILIFLGFEQCFVLGEEVDDPHGNVPKAIYAAFGVVRHHPVPRDVRDDHRLRPPTAWDGSGDLVASQGTPCSTLVKARIGQGWGRRPLRCSSCCRS